MKPPETQRADKLLTRPVCPFNELLTFISAETELLIYVSPQRFRVKNDCA